MPRFDIELRQTPIDAPRQVTSPTIIEAYESAGLEGRANAYHEQIAGQVASDPRKEYTAAAFEQGFASLLRTIRGRPAALRADLAR